MNESVPAEPKRTSTSGRAASHRLTRKRVPLSCESCRVRKLKCNRQRPCQNCIARGTAIAATCTYAEKTEKKSTARVNPRSNAGDMRDRLNRLESSILSMISDQSSTYPSPAQELSDMEKPKVIAPLEQAEQKLTYDTKSTHWDAVLSELGAMKEAWSEENDKIEHFSNVDPQNIKAHRPGLLNGLTAPPDRAKVLGSLPSREASDKLLVQFFGSYNPAIPARYVLHKATFLKQYNQHWTDPSKTKIMWIGLLFSIYTIAMHSFIMANEIPHEYDGTAPSLKELYRVRTVQCLLIADISKPTQFMIETINLHALSEYSDERDGDMNTGLLSVLMMRLALQKGYHRDPSHHPNISVFQGEMRRRIWSAVSQGELLFSAQLGLPKALRNYEADTESPRNLHEEELYEDMTVLPPSRPLTEDTEVSYQVVKYRLMRSWGSVIDLHHIIHPQPYEEVLKLDQVLLDAHTIVPPHLKLASLHEMKFDVPSRVIEKYILDVFYHKAVCILHRKYWKPEAIPGCTRDNAKYSRKRCVSSAIIMLQHQETSHTACAPGGVMSPFKWYHFSITNHDFLLAAMVLCLDIMNSLHELDEVKLDCGMSDTEKFELLRRSRTIWEEIIDDCRDARRAVRVLTVVLGRIEAKMRQRESEAVTRVLISSEKMDQVPVAFSGAEVIESTDSLRRNPYFVNQYGLGQASGNQIQSSDRPDSLEYTQPIPEIDSLMQDGMLDGLSVPADFNWDTWDNFMGGQYEAAEQSGDMYLGQGTPATNVPASGSEGMSRAEVAYLFSAGNHDSA